MRLQTASYVFISMLLLAACGGGDGGGGDDGGTSGSSDGGATPMNDAGTDAGEPDAGSTPCPDGYVGPSCTDCATGYQDANGNGVCNIGCDGTPAIDCPATATCEESIETGARGCVCNEGYTGVTCELCASGYQDGNRDGSCELDCDATLDCSGNGTCAIEPSLGTRFCNCDPAFLAPDCLTPFEPSTTGLALWLDATISARFSVASGSAVLGWADRRTAALPVVEAPSAVERPVRVRDVLNGLPVVRFDGNDRLDIVEAFTGLNSDDYTIVIAAAPEPTTNFPQNVLSATPVDFPGKLIQIGRIDSPNYRYRHEGDMLDLSGFADTTEPKILAMRRIAATTPTAIRAVASDGAVIRAQDMTLSPVAAFSLGDLGGSLVTLSIGDGTFEGDIAEVLVYERALDNAELSQVQAYLAHKWGITP